MPACLDGPEYDSVSWEKVAFALYKNGQEVDRAAPVGLMNPGDNSKTFHASVENLRLHFGGMEKGDCLELWLEAALSNGMTGKCCVDGWMLDEEGITKLVLADEE